MQIGIIGLGLIGGSLGLGLKNKGNQIIGVDNNLQHQQTAIDLNIVDKIMELDEMIKNVEIILIAIPVNHIEDILPQILDKIEPHQIVMDAGSTKETICEAVKNHPNRAQFIAAHPLAGTEFSGPTAAIPNLFQNKKNIICDKELSSDSALNMALKICMQLEMETYFLDSKSHDVHLAYVSHLSHITSFMLGLTVLDIEKDEKQILNLASTGFQSTVRLAKSSPKTWNPIFNKNKDNIITALDKYINYMQKFRNELADKNELETFEMMNKANKIKRVLK